MQEPPKSLVRALETLLRPLVRLMIARGITFVTVADILKALYVRVADEEFGLADRGQTASRITLLTGVHRKEVKRLREESPGAGGVPPQISLSAEIIGRWVATPELVDAEGRPLPIPRTAPAGQPSFTALAESVSRDLRPRAVLDELERVGAVRVDAEGLVHLDVAAFVPRAGFDEKAYYFGRNLRDHVAAGAHNLETRGKPFFDRAVFCDELTPESARRLADLAERAGMQALLQINREALRLSDRDKGSPAARQRITFGAFFLNAEEAAESPPETGEP